MGSPCALAEAAIVSGCGAELSLGDDATELFGEVGGRAVLACDPERRDEIIGLAAARSVRIQDVGTAGGATLLGVELSQLRSAWDGT